VTKNFTQKSFTMKKLRGEGILLGKTACLAGSESRTLSDGQGPEDLLAAAIEFTSSW
jgi:hypothetical protein